MVIKDLEKKQIRHIGSFSLIFVDTSRKSIFEKAYCGECACAYFIETLKNRRKVYTF